MYLEEKRVRAGHADHSRTYDRHLVTAISYWFRKLAKQLFFQTWWSKMKSYHFIVTLVHLLSIRHSRCICPVTTYEMSGILRLKEATVLLVRFQAMYF